MKYYVSNNGYFYKEYKKGNIKRISADEYNRKNGNKYNQKGGWPETIEPVIWASNRVGAIGNNYPRLDSRHDAWGKRLHSDGNTMDFELLLEFFELGMYDYYFKRYVFNLYAHKKIGHRDTQPDYFGIYNCYLNLTPKDSILQQFIANIMSINIFHINRLCLHNSTTKTICWCYARG